MANLVKANVIYGQSDNRSLPVACDFSSLLTDPDIVIFPGFCDVHVHLREPGFLYKESIATGSRAAAKGGYTTVCSMPNLNPVPDCYATLLPQLEAIAQDAVIQVLPYGSITVGQMGEQLSDLEGLAPHVVAFSDDGRGVQSEAMMRRAMQEAKRLGKIVVAHCEVNSLLHGGYIHDGAYAKAHGHRGICSASEYEQIARDVRLAKEIGCKYHVCHISTKESVEIIRRAKREGVDVTCETAPHYLLMDETHLQEEGRFKMNPPLRSSEDRQALIEGVQDGTIDMIATDHAPHSAAEKARGLEKSSFGIVGIETAFPLLYTYLVQPGILTMDKLADLLSNNPRIRFGIPHNGWCAWKVGVDEMIDPDRFESKGRSTPFSGWKVNAKHIATFLGEQKVW